MKNIFFAFVFIILCTPLLTFGAVQKPTVFPKKTFISATATPLADHPTMGLYQLSFALRADLADVYLPTSPVRVKKGATLGHYGFQYGIYDGDRNRQHIGNSAALVMSTSSKVNGVYMIPKGETGTFTLLAIYNNEGNVADAYHLRLEGIQYMLEEIGNTRVPEINGFKKYKTKEIKLLK